MNALEFIATLTQALVWPVAIVVLSLLFKKQIVALFERLRTASFPGGTVLSLEAFAEAAIQPTEIEKPSDINMDVASAVVPHVPELVCWYLLKVANRTLEWGDHISILKQELEQSLRHSVTDRQAMVYLSAIYGILHNLLLVRRKGPFQEKKPLLSELTCEISPEVLRLLHQRVDMQQTGATQ
jgi:hypothetical protein